MELELGEKIYVDVKQARKKHEKFKKATKGAIEIILDNEASFGKTLEEALNQFLANDVYKQKKHDFVVNREDSNNFVRQTMEQMRNEVMVRCGKKTQQKFSPTT